MLTLLLLITAISTVVAVDDNSQVVCENCNNNTSLNAEINHADVMVFNNTHNEIVIENVEKKKGIIGNSSLSPLEIEKPKINLFIIDGTNITLSYTKNSNITKSTINTNAIIIEYSATGIVLIGVAQTLIHYISRTHILGSYVLRI